MTGLCPPGAVLILGIVLWAAVLDLLFRRIPNRLVLMVLAVTIAAWGNSWLQGMSLDILNEKAGLSEGLAAGFCVLIFGFVLQVKGIVGAGDVKIAAALSLWMGEDAILFLLIMSLAGGAMVLVLGKVRLLEEWLALAAQTWLQRRHAAPPWPFTAFAREDRRGLPYGPAVAAGVLFVIFKNFID